MAQQLNYELAFNESLAFRKDMEKFGSEYDLNITNERMDNSRDILNDTSTIDQFNNRVCIDNGAVKALQDAPYINPQKAADLYKLAISQRIEYPFTASLVMDGGLFSLSHVDAPLSIRVWYQAIQSVKKDRGGLEFRNILKSAVSDIEETTLFPKSKLFTQIVVDQTHDDNGRSHAENKRFDEAYEHFELTGEIDFTPDIEC